MDVPWPVTVTTRKLWIGPTENRRRDPRVLACLRAERSEHLRLIHEWRAAAEADGWQFGPTYSNEPETTAFKGNREGFAIHGIARPEDERHSIACVSLHIWGPDGLAIKPPPTYDMEAIRRGARACGYCEATDVDTVRVGFAGRCCLTCEPTIRPQVETRGWNS